MKYGLSPATIEKIVDIFSAYSAISEAVIYGSRAMGNYREGSDIDITLKGDISFDDLLRIENQLEEQMLPYKFDLSVYNTLKNNELLKHIDRVGKVFYKK